MLQLQILVPSSSCAPGSSGACLGGWRSAMVGMKVLCGGVERWEWVVVKTG